ncbi:TonB-dependent receptor [Microbulbifer sp. TRSA002]|uniref:TonB-dependent receptor n=1 Tax=Microbulbifer sp. TRSA002 TaxID=3243382 RepID=UPI004039272C
MTLKHWITISLAAALSLPGAAYAECPSSGIQIASGNLSQALISLGQQCKLSLLVRTSFVANYLVEQQVLQSPTGRFEPALNKLLEGTALSFKKIGTSSVAVIELPAEVPPLNQPPNSTQTEEVTVTGQSLTGSHLRHFHSDGYLPIDSLSRDQLEVTGAQTIADLLKFLPAISGNSTSTSVSLESNGAAIVSLRNLPANSTLVLINGRRIISDGFNGEATDLNTIPLAIVDRVEILKDGASAVYGSDAIAGVVNIILQKEFEGLSLASFYGQATKNDRQSEAHHLTWGWKSDRGNLMLNLSRTKREAIMSRDRDVTQSADSRTQGGSDQRSSAIPEGFIAVDRGNILTSQGVGIYETWSPENRFDYNNFSSAIPQTQSDSIYITGSFDMGESSFAFSEIMAVRSTGETTLSPTPVFTRFDNGNLVISTDNIYNTFGQDIYDVRRLMVELGPRRQNNRTNTWRFNTGLKGFWDEWQWELNASTHQSHRKETLSNVVDPNALSMGLKGPEVCSPATFCTPINLLGPSGSIDPDQLAYIRSKSVTNSDSRMTSLTFITDGAIKDFAANDILMATGVEFRRESLSLHSPQLSYIGSQSPGSTEGARIIKEAFAEISIPIKDKKLWLDGAIRISQYSDFGGTKNPKIAIRWKPISTLLFRSSYTSGFRAPTLTDTNQESYQSQKLLVDPCSEPLATDLPGCTNQSDSTRNLYLTQSSGNPDLVPEKSRTISLGLMWEPTVLKGLTTKLDIYNISENKVIGSNPQYLLDQNAYYGSYKDLVVRDTNGDITRIYASRMNQGNREVSGYDAATYYQFKLDNNAQVNLALNISRTLSYLSQNSPRGSSTEFTGTFTDISQGGNGSLPKWQANAGVYLKGNKWSLGYTIHYVGKLTETLYNQYGNKNEREISDWSKQDIQFTYSPTKDARLSIGLNNILDTPPPFAATASTTGYDYQTYDLSGRFIFGSISFHY